MPLNVGNKAGSLVTPGGGLAQVMPHICRGLYQLKENKAPRLALALAPLLKHLSPLPTRVYHSASRTDPSVAFSKTTLHFCKCNTKKMNEMLQKKCIYFHS